MSDDNVVEFPRLELPENLLTVTPPPLVFCQHDKLTIDRHSRSIACVRCGAALDPFDYLLTNAHTIGRAWEHHRIAVREIDALHQQISALKKEAARLRTTVKALRAKAGEVVSLRGRA